MEPEEFPFPRAVEREEFVDEAIKLRVEELGRPLTPTERTQVWKQVEDLLENMEKADAAFEKWESDWDDKLIDAFSSINRKLSEDARDEKGPQGNE